MFFVEWEGQGVKGWVATYHQDVYYLLRNRLPFPYVPVPHVVPGS